MNPVDNWKQWYGIKIKKNEAMIDFVKQTIKNNKIDVIVCYHSGHTLTMDAVKFLADLQIPIINEALDDERKFVSRKGLDGIHRGMKDICKYFTLSLTTSKSALIKYVLENGRVMYKPYAANPNVYRKLGLVKKYDVVFVGAKYGTRPIYINYLKQNGIDVLAKGDGWEDGPAGADEMIELFNQAKIILGFAGVGINDDIFSLKGRDFEAPLTGSIYMTQRHDELSEYFEIGKDIETYSSKEELLQKVRHYLHNESKREKIAENGYEKCLKNYTAKASYEKIFGYLGL
jgi:spore maturation protein CgeB